MNPGRESFVFVGWLGEDLKNTPHHPRFCLDSDLDTDDFANMGLFIDEVSRTVPTTFKHKNTLDNGIGIAAAASMFSAYESTEEAL